MFLLFYKRAWRFSLILLSCSFSTSLMAQNTEKIAVFAGGCFWCMEEAFDKVPGVTQTISGYSGGNTDNPSYKDVTYGNTGHREALQVHYDSSRISYQQLLDVFWRNIDPFDDGGQFCDRGFSYKSAIFYANEEQHQLALSSIKKIGSLTEQKSKIVTPIMKLTKFYPAESYHQDYHIKNPLRYKYYKYSCGRPARLEKLWVRQVDE